MRVTGSRFLAIWAAALVAITLVTGCAGMFERVDTSDARLQFAASQASARLVQAADQDDWAARAAAAQTAIDDMRAYVDANASATTQELINEAGQVIPWHRLSPADQALIIELYHLFLPDIEALVERGQLTEGDALSIHGLLDAFERGLLPYQR